MVPVVARAGCRGEDEDRRDDHEPKRDVRIKVATTIRFPLRAMGAFGDWLGSEGHADAWSCCGRWWTRRDARRRVVEAGRYATASVGLAPSGTEAEDLPEPNVPPSRVADRIDDEVRRLVHLW